MVSTRSRAHVYNKFITVNNLFKVADLDKEDHKKIMRLCEARRMVQKSNYNRYVPVLKTIKETRVYYYSDS